MRAFFMFLLVALGCASSGGSMTSAPNITHFTAAPSSLPTDGGTVTFSWEVTDATSLTIDHGVGAVSPVTSGTTQATVAATTVFALQAVGPGGTSAATANVTVACDPSPGTLSGTCNVPSAGQCVDFSQLSSVDLASLPTYCAGFGGQFGSVPCSSASRIGTCNVPPASPNTGVNCSPSGVILERYYSPKYTLETAQSACAGVPGTIFTPG